jgi:hypothetical protein
VLITGHSKPAPEPPNPRAVAAASAAFISSRTAFAQDADTYASFPAVATDRQSAENELTRRSFFRRRWPPLGRRSPKRWTPKRYQSCSAVKSFATYPLPAPTLLLLSESASWSFASMPKNAW